MKSSVKDGTAGMTGVIERVNYADVEEATSVLMDTPLGGWPSMGAYFRDDELEAV
ncbi:hypothetical protein ACIQPR_43780 [Streptomyces sp. NPDC091280]|uniref:hypothetical protein n=1 Tax=Streptomyces sp. NPDC091280 TaxID=3365984 RepID=UPI0037FFD7B1